MRAFLCLPVLLLSVGLAGPALAENWVNVELLKKRVPDDQMAATLRGDLADCSADARERALRIPVLQCSTNQDPGLFSMCLSAQEDAKHQREQLFKDAVVGCMARRGWLVKE